MDQKIALITGASRGLGAALAEALAPSHHVIAVARTTGALEELDDRIKAKADRPHWHQWTSITQMQWRICAVPFLIAGAKLIFGRIRQCTRPQSVLRNDG